VHENEMYEAEFLIKKQFKDTIKDLELLTSPTKVVLVISTKKELSVYSLDKLECVQVLSSSDEKSSFSLK
jgi:hypothetical protein